MQYPNPSVEAIISPTDRNNTIVFKFSRALFSPSKSTGPYRQEDQHPA
jgi:hypothetical protein